MMTFFLSRSLPPARPFTQCELFSKYITRKNPQRGNPNIIKGICCLACFISICLVFLCHSEGGSVLAAANAQFNIPKSLPAYVKTPSQVASGTVAEHFFPQQVWLHAYESCAWPASQETPGVVVYRMREHPRDASMLSITYSILYRNDCGGIFGLDNHPGDVESFSYTLVPDDTCSNGWRLFSVKTTAHSGAPGDVGEKIINDCEPLPEIFVSLRKHGTYLTRNQCNRNIDPTQRCSRGFTTDFSLINAGDPDQPLTDDLSAYFPSDPSAAVEYIWSGDGRFCGGQAVADRQECVASPGSKLTDDSLLAPARQFSTLFELGDDWESDIQATSIAFGDIDGDGIDEIGITRKVDENNRFFLFDDANQSFSSLLAAGDQWPMGSHATAIDFGDIDGDGLDEMGVTRRADSGALLFILDDASQGFKELFSGLEPWNGLSHPTAIAFGDIDGDGLDEIAVALQASAGVRFLVLDDYSNGLIPLFGAGQNWDADSYATSVAYGDVDGDGIEEIGISLAASAGPRYFLLDDALHSFSVLLMGGEDWDRDRHATSIALGDVDGDGLDEVGVTRVGFNLFDHREIRYWILDDAVNEFRELNRGGGGEPTIFPLYYEYKIAFGDMDGNGKAETGIGRTHNTNARYWILDDFEFGFNTTLTGSGGSSWVGNRYVTALDFGDVDGDGVDEIGLTRQSPDGMRVQVLSVVKPIMKEPWTVLIGLGDSLTHGTMDATNNVINTANAYLQKVNDAIGKVIPMYLNQPFFDL
ncbi:MAG: VCBS repeat-containing protein, partial [Deltaproteobacteria bacterium]